VLGDASHGSRFAPGCSAFTIHYRRSNGSLRESCFELACNIRFSDGGFGYGAVVTLLSIVSRVVFSFVPAAHPEHNVYRKAECCRAED